MARALIVGAGAIGRGFLPWTFENLDFDLFDTSDDLCQSIKEQQGYSSFMSIAGELVEKRFHPIKCTSQISELDFEDYCIAFVAVGPRNCSNLPGALSQLRCPIFSVENDPKSVAVISHVTKSQKVYFGVPDVITSSTAAPSNIEKDRNALHTEDGNLYLEDGPSISQDLRTLLPKVVWSSKNDMIREWDAKLFLHNTPHCVAAYLGSLCGGVYLHESFEKTFIIEVVEGVIEELLLALKREKDYDHIFLESYADKELKRFSNHLLYDPISRVAREPLRKLSLGGRLTGALTMCLMAGVNPVNLNLGIRAAFSYRDLKDRDYHAMSLLDHFGIKSFMKYFLNINPASIEAEYISSTFRDAEKYLRKGLE
jgi:mannitol-1-phosphate 5-dehydrogenase